MLLKLIKLRELMDLSWLALVGCAQAFYDRVAATPALQPYLENMPPVYYQVRNPLPLPVPREHATCSRPGVQRMVTEVTVTKVAVPENIPPV